MITPKESQVSEKNTCPNLSSSEVDAVNLVWTTVVPKDLFFLPHLRGVECHSKEQCGTSMRLLLHQLVQILGKKENDYFRVKGEP